MKTLQNIWMKSNETTKTLIKSAYIITIALLAGMLIYNADKAFGLTKKANVAMDSKVVVVVVKK